MSGLAGSWYRAAALRPRLRAHAVIHRHRYRGRIWHMLQDHQTGRFFRLSPSTHLLLCLMDGRRTTEEVWQLAGRRLGSDRPSRADTLGLLAQMHQADLLHAGLPADPAEIDRRARQARRNPLLAALRNPMAVRLPLLDPDCLLERSLPLAQLLFSRAGLALWCVLLAIALVLAAVHWPALTDGVSDRVFSTQNVVILALVYPAVKALHELAHAYTTKLSGGQVHEMGIMLLVLFPVPYVDASASCALPNRWDRAGVAAAGVMAELALAAIAMMAWTQLDPGLPRAVAYNVMLLAGVTTLAFNANPLLRFDGYYVLSDLIEIPNLDTRSKKYLQYILQRYLLGQREVSSPVEAAGEPFWFVTYGLISLGYRLFVMLGIALLVAGHYFVVGAVLAALSIVQMVVLPAARALRHVAAAPSLRRRRGRAALGVGGAALLLGGLLFVIPLPHATVSDGVVLVPERATLRAGADGVVARLLAPPDTDVTAGTPLLAMDDPVASARVDVDRARVAVLESRFLATNLLDRAQALLVQDALDRARARLAAAERQQAELLVRADNDGRFVVPDVQRLLGQWRRKGAVLGYVIGADDPAIRVVVPQADIDLVRRGTVAASIRFAERIDTVLPARVVRETPAALDAIPAPALSTEGGGPMLADPSSHQRERPLERFYEVELQPRDRVPLDRVGSHAYARFEHPAEPIAWRLLRHVRRVVLRQLQA